MTIGITFEIVISTGERQRLKVNPSHYLLQTSPHKIIASLQIGKKKYRLYSTFSIKISLLAVWNKVNIAALKIHMWAEHLVFAECSFFFSLTLIYLLRIKTFQKCKDIYGSILLKNLWKCDRLHHSPKQLPCIRWEIPGRQHIQKLLLNKRETSI